MEQKHNEDWSETISSQTKWHDLKLDEIWEYRDLISIFIKRDIISLYKQTILGPVWFFISPLFTVLIYVLIFGRVAQIPTDGIPSTIFYLSGITMWNYFNSAFSATSNTFVSNAAIYGKVYFPRMVTPISLVISNLIKFGFQFTLYLAFWIYFLWKGQIHPNIYIAYFPLLLILMAGIALGCGIIISSMTTKYRDITYFISFGITLLMYATPVIYPMSLIKNGKMLSILHLNPLSPIIETFRYGFTGAGSFSNWGLLYSFSFMCICLFIGLLIFNKVQKSFMDTV